MSEKRVATYPGYLTRRYSTMLSGLAVRLRLFVGTQRTTPPVASNDGLGRFGDVSSVVGVGVVCPAVSGRHV